MFNNLNLVLLSGTRNRERITVPYPNTQTPTHMKTHTHKHTHFLNLKFIKTPEDEMKLLLRTRPQVTVQSPVA